jgi:hypothetical protein
MPCFFFPLPLWERVARTSESEFKPGEEFANAGPLTRLRFEGRKKIS